MRYSTLGFVGLAALAAATDVHDLTTESFEPFVNDHGLVLAECKYMGQVRHTRSP